MLNTQQITALPQVTTSNVRELQWSIEWNARQYGEASLASGQAWELYISAIDNNASKEEINDILTIATMFDNMKEDAYHAWQNAKRDYLALMN
jgi:hypothetical protein